VLFICAMGKLSDVISSPTDVTLEFSHITLCIISYPYINITSYVLRDLICLLPVIIEVKYPHVVVSFGVEINNLAGRIHVSELADAQVCLYTNP
jgi:hypothetical protein